MSSWTPEMAERARAIIADEASYARHEPLDLLEAALERIDQLERVRVAAAQLVACSSHTPEETRVACIVKLRMALIKAGGGVER